VLAAEDRHCWSFALTLVRSVRQTRCKNATAVPTRTAPLNPTGQAEPQQGHAAPEKKYAPPVNPAVRNHSRSRVLIPFEGFVSVITRYISVTILGK
tara:strand:- start:1807 stop:2094 length:288 start_codon:yes stop_codon:yes gene_type:complete